MRTLINQLAEKLTKLDIQLCTGGPDAAVNNQFKAVVAAIESFGYRVDWNIHGNCFVASFWRERALSLGIAPSDWPEAEMEAWEAEQAALHDAVSDLVNDSLGG